MGVSESTVKSARDKENSVITQRSGGTKVFHLKWLHKCLGSNWTYPKAGRSDSDRECHED